MIDTSAAERRNIEDNNDDVPPLRGCIIPVAHDPMACAMGYRSIAASRLDCQDGSMTGKTADHRLVGKQVYF